MKYRNRIAYIVPTKDHPDDLAKLLESLRRQTRLPDQIIIVDGGDNVIEGLIAPYKDLGLDYVRLYPPGLTKQRNEGMRHLKPDITLIGYLDDDLVLEAEATEKMLVFWESASPGVGGASFNITNNIPTPFNPFTYLFWINQGKQGVILKSGFNVILFPVIRDTRVEWLCGGATVWRKEVIDRNKFEEWFLGCAYIDDIDYCMRVRKKYDLYVIAGARVQHYAVPVVGKKNYELAKANIINRYYFVRKYPELSLPLFFWAVFGHIMGNFVIGLATLNKIKIIKALGGMAGVYSVLSRDLSDANRNFHK